MPKWVEINWRKAHQRVYSFQKKIYTAAIYQDLNSVWRLQDKLLTDQIAELVAIQQNCQENSHKVSKNGYKIRHHTNQTLFKLAFDPQAEAQFPASHYGFRFGRSSSDAVAAILKAMGQLEKHVLSFEVEICQLDRFLQVTSFNSELAQEKKGQYCSWTKGQLPPLQFVPLFLNIVLTGLKKKRRFQFLNQSQLLCPSFQFLKKQVEIKWELPSVPSNGLISIVVYRHHVLLVSSSVKKLLQTYASLRLYMSIAGLTSKNEQIGGCSSFFCVYPGFKSSSQTFTFQYTLQPTIKYIGLNFCYNRMINNKRGTVFLSDEQFSNHLSRLRNVTIRLRSQTQTKLFSCLKDLIFYWSKRYSSYTRARLLSWCDNYVYWLVVKWSMWNHPNKAKKWVKDQYWTKSSTINGLPLQENKLKLAKHRMFRKIIVKVEHTRSPFDNDWIYWSSRFKQTWKYPLFQVSCSFFE